MTNRYLSIHAVPRRWRSISGTPLSLDQVEGILTAAEAAVESFAVALGNARRDFVNNNHVVAGQWVGN